MRRATVLATVVLALGALGAPAMAVAPDAVPDEGAASLDRLDGETRFDTAALTALRAFPDGANTVLIATGLNFPDALAASFLAGGDTQAPILLVEREHIPAETADAIEQLGPENIVVLGGDDAIADETVQELADTYTGADVDVIGGATRIETAAMIARQGGPVGTAPDLTDDEDAVEGEEELTTAIVARAGDFPDALASGPLALEGRHPILLTPTDTLDETTRDALTDGDLGIEQVILAGGTVAISEDVEQEIASLDNITSVARVSGENRTATAVELAELTRATLGWDGSHISLARGDFFPDALTVAPLAAELDASLFLSRNPQTIEGDTFEGIQELCEEAEELVITGGTDAITLDAAGEAKLATICADYTFPISGEQSVEGGDEDAAGTGWVTIVDDTVCTAYDVEGLEGQATDSHIIQGEAGTTGDPVIDLGQPNINGFLADCTEDADAAIAITATPWEYYVNIHTSEYPQGAARGQLAETPLEPAAEFVATGDAVLGDTGVPGFTADAELVLNDEGQVCLTLTNVSDDTVELAAAQLFEGAVDEEAPADAAPIASFEEITVGEQVCSDVTDPSLLLQPGDQLYLSVDNTGGDEIARGQVDATAEATLMDGDTEAGTALLYRGADATYVCGIVDIDAEGVAPNGDVTVNAADDTEVAVFAAADVTEATDFACDETAAETEPETILVPVTGDTEGDGELTGDFTPDETPDVA